MLKASLYLTDLPVQYRVKNFTRSNLQLIEANWDTITNSLTTTVRLIGRYGFHWKNIVAPLALLPIALYVKNQDNLSFDTSSAIEDSANQIRIRKWFILSTLKNAFGGSSDTTLTRLRDLLGKRARSDPFPADEMYESLGIEPAFTEAELDRFLAQGYQGRYTNL